jgi:type II secretory pathway component PulF
MDGVQLSGVASVLAMGAALVFAGSLLAAAPPRNSPVAGVLRYTGWTLLVVGVLAVWLLVAGWLGLIAWPITMVIWARAAWNYRAVQKRNLLAALALAAHQNMPLAPMARAFAEEQDRGFAARVRALAARLEQGLDPKQALAESHTALPPEAALAAAVARDTGDLAGALDATTYASVFDRGWLQPMIARLFYLLGTILCMVVVISFLQIKVAPSWVKILQDFDMQYQVPALTLPAPVDPPLPNSWIDWMVVNLPPAVYTVVFYSATLAMLILWALLFLTIAAIYTWLQWRGTLMPRLPGLRRIINWVDMAPILRILALEAKAQRPLPGTLETVAALHPKRAVRRRMRRVAQEVNRGVAWQESLRQQGLLRGVDAAVLGAATRSGNTPWALTQMADSFERKASWRLKALVQVVAPLAILPLALGVAFVAWAYFLPIGELIKGLS